MLDGVPDPFELGTLVGFPTPLKWMVRIGIIQEVERHKSCRIEYDARSNFQYRTFYHTSTIRLNLWLIPEVISSTVNLEVPWSLPKNENFSNPISIGRSEYILRSINWAEDDNVELELTKMEAQTYEQNVSIRNGKINREIEQTD